MITYDDGVFRLATDDTVYILRVTKYGHLEHVYYGKRLDDGADIEPLLLKRVSAPGSSVMYSKDDASYCLDAVPLEWSGVGSGDYRETPCEVKLTDGSFATDFTYVSHEIKKGFVPPSELPSAYGEDDECDTLSLTLADGACDMTLTLFYTVYTKPNVITRRTVLKNGAEGPVFIRKLMSSCLDMPNREFKLVTFDGGWIKEAVRRDRPLQVGTFVISSATGTSSNRHNPGFLLAENLATEDYGRVYGFNLVYSGNHYSSVELSAFDTVRVQSGINPHCFEWELKSGESFETPEAVMTCSVEGFNGMSRNFHEFVNNHIVRGEWKNRERPVLINNWESCFFKFTEGKLLRLARRARRLGIELFVLDDGWFGERNSDFAGLGDYGVNRKKLPSGMKGFSNRIKSLGMMFGLWFEPEMVNEDSELYRAHPEYALKTPGRTPALGRNQLVLDLCNPEVRDYIVRSVSGVLDDAGIQYVKWDMNRHISDAYSPTLKNQGEFYHRYVLGLYDVLKRVFGPRGHILLESCSSGGNRFDLGMLCFSPQIWASDDTDPIERLKIQGGLSYLYPLSTMGAHVSASPHQQTLRDTPLPTRFNVAAFGCLGYELELKYLSRAERAEVKAQIEFYKKHRKTLQFGRFYRREQQRPNKLCWQCVGDDKGSSAAGLFQTLSSASEGYDRLDLTGLDQSARYSVKTRPQSLFVKRFGGLMKHVLPLELDPEGIVLRTLNRVYALTDCVESYDGTGQTLMQGVKLNNQFIGTYYNKNTRLLGDFGSSLYEIEKN